MHECLLLLVRLIVLPHDITLVRSELSAGKVKDSGKRGGGNDYVSKRREVKDRSVLSEE